MQKEYIINKFNKLNMNEDKREIKELCLYRYEIDYFGGDFGEMTDVILIKFKVVKQTNSFYIINMNENRYGGEKLKRCSKDAKSSYAYTNKERALKNFKKRTEKRIAHLNYFMEKCEEALEIVNTKGFKR